MTDPIQGAFCRLVGKIKYPVELHAFSRNGEHGFVMNLTVECVTEAHGKVSVSTHKAKLWDKEAEVFHATGVQQGDLVCIEGDLRNVKRKDTGEWEKVVIGTAKMLSPAPVRPENIDSKIDQDIPF